MLVELIEHAVDRGLDELVRVDLVDVVVEDLVEHRAELLEILVYRILLLLLAVAGHDEYGRDDEDAQKRDADDCFFVQFQGRTSARTITKATGTHKYSTLSIRASRRMPPGAAPFHFPGCGNNITGRIAESKPYWLCR